MNSFGNEVTDPENIINEFRSEFQHRLRIREPQDHIKGYELLHNTLCELRLQNCTTTESPDFPITELKAVLGELKGSKCADSSGFIREIFQGVVWHFSNLCLTCLIGSRKTNLSHYIGIRCMFKL